MKREILRNFFKKYIDGTPHRAIVPDRKLFLCRLTKAVMRGVNVRKEASGVYVTSRLVKHLFDKRPAEEFMFILDNLHKVAKHPDKIYKNKDGKRGEFCFVKNIGGAEYFCSVEVVELSDAESTREEVQVATVFRVRDDKYLKNYTLLWDWGNGNPHRSALDAPEGSTNAPQ